MRIVILGPPGAGKGTQAKLLACNYNIAHIATGDILRQAVAERSYTGEKVASYIMRGYLVPDEIIMELIRETLKKNNLVRSDFILDGIPRTISQLKDLQEFLTQQNSNLELAIYIKLRDEEILRRLGGRRVCPSCGNNYHIIFSPPVEENLCNYCRIELKHRQDDKEDAIKQRLEEYENKTYPCIQYYKKEGILEEVDGEGSIEEVFARVNKIVLERFKR